MREINRLLRAAIRGAYAVSKQCPEAIGVDNHYPPPLMGDGEGFHIDI